MSLNKMCPFWGTEIKGLIWEYMQTSMNMTCLLYWMHDLCKPSDSQKFITTFASKSRNLAQDCVDANSCEDPLFRPVAPFVGFHQLTSLFLPSPYSASCEFSLKRFSHFSFFIHHYLTMSIRVFTDKTLSFYFSHFGCTRSK